MKYKILKASRHIDEYDNKSKIDAPKFLNFINGAVCFPISRRKSIHLKLDFDEEETKYFMEFDCYGVFGYSFNGYDIAKNEYSVYIQVCGDRTTEIWVYRCNADDMFFYTVEKHVNPEHFIKGFDLKKYVLDNFDAIFRPELFY